MHSRYTQDYVRFFLGRNGLSTLDDAKTPVARALSDTRIASAIGELQGWPCSELRNHKDLTHAIHKLSFLVELGVTRSDPGVQAIYDRILSVQSRDGPFEVLIDIPKSFGGSGAPVRGWMMCDAPLVAYAVVKLNKGIITKPIRKALDAISGLVKENGWHCNVSESLGHFHGPGRRGDPCPYATLLALKMLSLTPGKEYARTKGVGLQTILGLWEERKTAKPYLFAMGTDFQKLKLPFIWYDILHVVDIMSRYPEAYNDKRFREMLGMIDAKGKGNAYVPESVYLAAKEWDFGQKKQPSEYMSAIVERINGRMQRYNGVESRKA